MKRRIVLKFGGTSLQSDMDVKRAADIVSQMNAGFDVIVVVSARGETTDILLKQADVFCKKDSIKAKAEYDSIISSGEQISSGIMSLSLIARGLRARSYMGWQLPIETNDHHCEGKIINISTEKIENSLRSGEIPVICGFQGVYNDRVVTLGRGGSDITAVSIAAAMKAKCIIYTDVKGLYTTNPRENSKAKMIDYISPLHLLEMTSAGAEVVHPRAAGVALRYNVEMAISSPSDTSRMTQIKQNNMEKKSITGIILENDISFISIDCPTDSMKILRHFNQENVDINSIRQEDDKNTLIMLKNEHLDHAKSVIEAKFSALPVKIIDDLSIVSILGHEIGDDISTLLAVNEKLCEHKERTLFLESSPIKIRFTINKKSAGPIVNELHAELIEEDEREPF